MNRKFDTALGAQSAVCAPILLCMRYKKSLWPDLIADCAVRTYGIACAAACAQAVLFLIDIVH